MRFRMSPLPPPTRRHQPYPPNAKPNPRPSSTTPQAFELATVRHDFLQWQQWMVGGGWDRWWKASRAPKAAGGFGAAAEEQAWGTQFFRAFKCFFYGFVACVVPAKASEPKA